MAVPLRARGDMLDMAYREKTNWLTLIAMVIAYTVYFSIVLPRGTALSLLQTLWLFAQVTITQAVVVIIGNIVLAARTDKRARVADERDRAIARRGATSGYYTLLVGMILVGVVAPFDDLPRTTLLNYALLWIVIAEAVRLTTIVSSYRRGWHG
ncbi:hypothetical protein ACFO8O_07420 [Hephaestia sp. GCM10023244]|uniref:hypothetical protein n=1 Tax=unclassified Hephaestia TaxID=2631281 RepID=UPI00207745BF|nr:hypothetical protein [Hephaestia sp. MAHUQ-44]MCM8730796.1 hypothetical protein [Hephaestia sp. MAHUQ-44]